MKKSHACLLLLVFFLALACDQSCPMTGSPHTKYSYAYFDSDGVDHLGSVTTDSGANASVGDVPSDVNCNKVTYWAEPDEFYLM